MNKQEFLYELEKRLSGLPYGEIRERVDFYREMIDDRIEEGLSETDAVRDIGDIEQIVSQILKDVPLTSIVKEKIKPRRRLEAWEIVLIILGAPVWLPLLISAITVILSLYVAIWSVIISLWAVFGSLCAVSASAIGLGLGAIFSGNTFPGVALTGAGLVCAGLSILLFFGSDAASDGLVKLTKKSVLGIKKCFVGKERAQ